MLTLHSYLKENTPFMFDEALINVRSPHPGSWRVEVVLQHMANTLRMLQERLLCHLQSTHMRR